VPFALFHVLYRAGGHEQRESLTISLSSMKQNKSTVFVIREVSTLTSWNPFYVRGGGNSSSTYMKGVFPWLLC
jgi:hypothetical protein